MHTLRKRYSVEEYEALERLTDKRHEYFDGELSLRVDCNRTHCSISVNLCAELGKRLKGRYFVFGSDLRILCPTGLRTYPDLSVTGRKPEFEDRRGETLLNPQLVIEVLSKSTAAYDRGRKFVNYQTIPSLREVVFVDQDQMHVEVHTRATGGQWKVATCTDAGATVELPGVECSLPMQEIYFGIDWSDPAPQE